MGGYFDLLLQVKKDAIKLATRNKRPGTCNVAEEPMSERDFVRAFGTKVKSVRYSNRQDFVGLMICGANTGFWVVMDKETKLRKCRIITIMKGRVVVTNRELKLKADDSMSNLQRGLLRWVQ